MQCGLLDDLEQIVVDYQMNVIPLLMLLRLHISNLHLAERKRELVQNNANCKQKGFQRPVSAICETTILELSRDQSAAA
jgi:hypothetical protein